MQQNGEEIVTNCAKSGKLMPVFLIMKGKKCVLIGGGDVAERKVHDLISAEAAITVIAEKPNTGLERMNKEGLITLETRRFQTGDLKGAFIAFAATDDTAVNKAVWQEAEKESIPVNVIDVPELCTFYSGAAVNRGPLQIAISTNGCSPFMAGAIRRELEAQYTEDFGDYILAAGELRLKLLEIDGLDQDKKREALKSLAQKESFERYLENGTRGVWDELKKIISIS